MTANNTPPHGAMFRFTYRQDPKHNPDLVFDVLKFFEGTESKMILDNVKYYAHKTGAIAVNTVTEAQYKELLNEEAKQKKTAATTA